ncbi:zinc carboxypeptidase-like [Colias croceus]|uniref:zinc carboxypeptidase-like n=1 Tax=Colias crocea TaxID=72248 RepID=UPI001E27EB10|nr:zinc carboxypeptidase-like [Colias croceus]
MYRYLFIILTYTLVSAKFRFDNYTLYKIIPENEKHIQILQDILEYDQRYDFWTYPAPGAKFVNIMSSPENKADLENTFNSNDIKFSISMTNVQEVIDKETVGRYTRSNLRSMRWDTYYNLRQINDWLDDIVSRYSNAASIIVGGESFEGRPIRGVKISHGSGRRAIFIESGIHAREWITMATTNYIIDQLLRSNDPEVQAAARDYDWYIFPVTNPDGYVWSHEEFRMWRKNRRPIGSQFGVDLNRNWNSNWLLHGSSTNPATDNYAGPGPFSEPESRTLSEYIRSLSGQIDLYLSMHSFSELLLLPFGNSTQQYANYQDAISIGRRAMGALSVRYGTQYTTGNIAEAIYLATGGSIDWVKSALNIPLVYCYEFRDKGQYGFLLPANQIRPNSEEVLDSLLEMIHQAKRFGYMNGSASGSASSLRVSLWSMLCVIVVGFMRK